MADQSQSTPGQDSTPDARFDNTVSNRELRARWAVDTKQDPYSIDLSKLNPGHGDLFEANVMLPYFERLRAEAPVHYCEDSQYGPYWSITKFDDIKYVDSHHELFSSDIRNGGIRLGGRPMLDTEPDPTFSLPMFIMQDQPTHDEQRAVVAPMFSPRSLAALSDLIRERAGRILDNLPDGDFNWVREVSVELTGQMLATLFDIPQEDRHKLIHWSDTVERIGDPDYFETPEEGFQELWKCFEYFNALWQERRNATEPGSDLISFLAHGEATRDMPPNELLGNVLLLIVGGNDTTRNSISGGVLALNQFPDQYARLKADQSLIGNMVSEIIRFQSPVAHMCRTALVDTELHGHLIRQWDKVCIWYLSGNRDEDYLPDGNNFVIDRPNARQHTSFGFGIHRCLGNRLAEMQLRIIWEEIMARFEHVEVTGEPTYLNSSFIRGIVDLPVRVHRR